MLRLDQALVLCELVSSREKAKAAICAGMVLVNGQKEHRPSHAVEESDVLSLLEDQSLLYVGRGSFKLLKCLDFFEISVIGLHCLDVGASTGGFTQVLLERGAAQVYAVDVGTKQLAEVLKTDPRVVCMEQTDIRTVTRAQIGEVDFACIDVSFISLKHILPTLFHLLNEESAVACLLKPQFEVGPHRVKKGVVKDPHAQVVAIEEVLAAARAVGFKICGVTHSPICGGAGNIEYFLYIYKGICINETVPNTASIVRLAWEDLKR